MRIAVAAVIPVVQRIVANSVTTQLNAAVDLTVAIDTYLAVFTGISAAAAIVIVPIQVGTDFVALFQMRFAVWICQIPALAVDANFIRAACMIACTTVLVIFGRIAAYVPAACCTAVVGIAFRDNGFGL